MKRVIREIVHVGMVADIPHTSKYAWTTEDDVSSVKDHLRGLGFNAEDLEPFLNFLTVTETGEYTEIYGIKNAVPWAFIHAYRFKVDGVAV